MWFDAFRFFEVSQRWTHELSVAIKFQLQWRNKGHFGILLDPIFKTKLSVESIMISYCIFCWWTEIKIRQLLKNDVLLHWSNVTVPIKWPISIIYHIHQIEIIRNIFCCQTKNMAQRKNFIRDEEVDCNSRLQFPRARQF